MTLGAGENLLSAVHDQFSPDFLSSGPLAQTRRSERLEPRLCQLYRFFVPLPPQKTAKNKSSKEQESQKITHHLKDTLKVAKQGITLYPDADKQNNYRAAEEMWTQAGYLRILSKELLILRSDKGTVAVFKMRSYLLATNAKILYNEVTRCLGFATSHGAGV